MIAAVQLTGWIFRAILVCAAERPRFAEVTVSLLPAYQVLKV